MADIGLIIIQLDEEYLYAAGGQSAVWLQEAEGLRRMHDGRMQFLGQFAPYVLQGSSARLCVSRGKLYFSARKAWRYCFSRMNFSALMAAMTTPFPAVGRTRSKG